MFKKLLEGWRLTAEALPSYLGVLALLRIRIRKFLGLSDT